jgi:hypothetical protein
MSTLAAPFAKEALANPRASRKMRTMRLIKTMKKELCASLALLLACACAWPQVPDSLKRIQDRGQVNVGFSEEAPPFSLRVDGGAPIGWTNCCASSAPAVST